MTTILGWLVALQATIHGAIAQHIEAFAASGDWLTLLAVLPMGMLFGAAHGLTPGHNKLVLASYVVGDSVPALRASLMALVRSCRLCCAHCSVRRFPGVPDDH